MPPRKRTEALKCKIPVDHKANCRKAPPQGVDIHVQGSEHSEEEVCPLGNVNPKKRQRSQVVVTNTKSGPRSIQHSSSQQQQGGPAGAFQTLVALPDCHLHKRKGRLVVTFLQGPLAHGLTDGHPRHEGQTARRVRDLGNNWGKAMRISKSEIKVWGGLSIGSQCVEDLGSLGLT